MSESENTQISLRVLGREARSRGLEFRAWPEGERGVRQPTKFLRQQLVRSSILQAANFQIQTFTFNKKDCPKRAVF